VVVQSDAPVGNARIAVVPLRALDESAEHALAFASTLADHVVALHVRTSIVDSQRAFEDAWTRRAPAQPALVLEPSSQPWPTQLATTLDVLKRTAGAEQILVVVPREHAQRVRWAVGARPQVIVLSPPATA
jgi:hypothetical protein